jgi:glucose/arabinose dehydrogenase
MLTVMIVLYITQLNAKSLHINDIRLPPGFSIQVYSANVPDARSLAVGEGGTVFVGSRTAGRVYALIDSNHDNRADRVLTVARGRLPNGVAFHKGSLYVAEVNRVTRYDSIESHLEHPLAPVILRDDFPDKPDHGWKFIRFGPDSLLYVPIGAPCNSCVSTDPRFATITRMRPDGSQFEIFAYGVRNSVGFDWHPSMMQLWFTDNGRDELGDNKPPDELNYAPRQEMNFGFPYCYGDTVSDPVFGAGNPCRNFTAPTLNLPAHVAPLGMRFYTGKMFPEEFRGTIFIAEHGSWNRSAKVGYRVTMVQLHDVNVISYREFANGWLQGQSAWGRPVDIEIMPDGALLVSDDFAGAVYRISFRNEQK